MRFATLCFLILTAACSNSGGDSDPVYTPAPCEGIYGSVYTQCSQRVLGKECAGAFGFGLLICIGHYCPPEARQAVWDCCQMAYTSQADIEACSAAQAP